MLLTSLARHTSCLRVVRMWRYDVQRQSATSFCRLKRLRRHPARRTTLKQGHLGAILLSINLKLKDPHKKTNPFLGASHKLITRIDIFTTNAKPITYFFSY